MALLSAIIQRGTRGSQPAASAVATGTLYCVTDESNALERSSGSAWQAYAPSAGGVSDGDKGDITVSASGATWTIDNSVVTPAKQSTAAKTRALTAVIGDGSNTISTGVAGYVPCPYTGTITKATLIASDASFTSGAIVIDVWKDTFANRPPDNSDSITASAPPTITATGSGSEDSTLTGWSTSVTAGDVFGFNVDSVTSMKKVTLMLTIVLS